VKPANIVEPVEFSRRRSAALIGGAVHRHRALSRAGLSERAFTLAFSSLVYPQIWEDPIVDMEAMSLAAGQHVVAIASGGCNILSYVSQAPVTITAVDLNTAHVALNRLKIAAARHLERYDDFHSLFGNAASPRNVELFDRCIAQHLDAESWRYWTRRDWRGRRRIECLARGLYRHGLLGRFIAVAHVLARALGANPRAILAARSQDEQCAIYERELKPVLARPVVRKLLGRRAALFGLGIPPAQYDALCGGRPMHEVIEERLERLACGFDLQENYFAWQAFNRGYAPHGQGPLPPYLQRDRYPELRANAARVRIVHASFTDHLATLSAESVDRYVLLDAQDWMGDGDLNGLWREITRTARPGARVIFRTAGAPSILPGRVEQRVLGRWTYHDRQSAELTGRDRSAIYGGFHLYVRAD
jgi:S-adenosylmethionine-diacylglycerol 3-amino-3-carboxypropyl transferase